MTGFWRIVNMVIEAKIRYRFTYFSAEGVNMSPKDAPANAQFEPLFYSQHYLQKQVWKENDREYPEYKGWIPFGVLVDTLNDRLVGDKYDFRKVYKNWRYKYERGYYYPGKYHYVSSRNEKGTRVSKRIVDIPARYEITFAKEDSKGNPPPNRENNAW